jgi:hypothetical protein
VEEPDGLTRICEWLENDGWDCLIADLDEQYALKLSQIAQLRFSDEEARHNLDIPMGVELGDTDRLSWARQCLDYAQTEGADRFVASLHAYRLIGGDGSFAFVGCSIVVHGQYGATVEWWGLWRTPEEFYDAVGDGNYWVTPRMGEISDQVILSLWQQPNRPGKKHAC